MAIENIPIWSIPPNWQEPIIESLEWLTALMRSPTSVEQRFANRLSPRQSFEMSFTVWGPTRTFFDMLMIRGSGLPLYFPLWFEIEKLTADASIGSSTLALETEFTEFAKAKFVFIRGPDPFNYEIGEVSSVAGASITLVDPLEFPWPAGTKVYPLKKCQVEIQPTTDRKADRALTARCRFRSLESNPSADGSPLNTYNDLYVLEQHPNEIIDMTYSYQRVMSEIDNRTGMSKRRDVSGHILQQYAWFAKQKVAHSQLRGLFYALQGRRMPIWVPTFYADFDLVADIDDNTMDVKRCGFTDMGGPSFNRETIVIELHDGTRLYRTITDSALVGDGSVERLVLDASASITKAEVRRISFLVLSRLDQDVIEIQHYTDTKGVAAAAAVFRSAANLEATADPLNSAVCLTDFRWSEDLTSAGIYDEPVNVLDKFGNYYVSQLDSSVKIYDPTGSLISTMTQGDLADMVDTYYGSPIVDRRLIGGGFTLKPLLAGEYVLAYKQSVFRYAESGGNIDWFVILVPAASGDPTFGGVVAIDRFLGPPYQNYMHIIGLANNQTINDPILYRGSSGVGADEWDFAILPSINDIISGTYDAGYPGYPDLQVKDRYYRPIGNVNFSTHMFLATSARNLKSGFVLPNADGGTNLYFYINRETMDWNLSHSTGAGANPDIKGVLQPAYPNGCIVKIHFDPFSYVDIAEAITLDSEDYTVDNANWVDAAAAVQIPFTDEYTYVSTEGAGGNDAYCMEVSTTKRADGTYWVVFYKPGIDDANANTGGTLHETLRVFIYNPATEVATEIQRISCVVHTSSEITGTGFADSNQAIQVVEDEARLVTIWINGYNVLPSTVGKVYRDRFAQFNIGDA